MTTGESEYTKESLTQGIRKLRSREALGALFLVVKYFPQVRGILANSGDDTNWREYLSRALGEMASLNGEEFINDFMKFSSILLTTSIAELDHYDFSDLLSGLGKAWELNGMTEQVGGMMGNGIGAEVSDPVSEELRSEEPLEFPNFRELIK